MFLDVRTEEEFLTAGKIPQTSIHIPLDELREHLDQLDRSKKIYVNCHSGLRSHRLQNPHRTRLSCYNLSGGYRLYEIVAGDKTQYDTAPKHPCGIDIG